MQCRIKRFDPSTIKPHRIILIIARRGSGKSTLLKDLLYHQRSSIDMAIGMCPTMEAAEMMRECMPKSCVFDRFMPGKIEQIVGAAQDMVARGKKRGITIICDDCMYDKSAFKSTAIRSIFFNGRHLFCNIMSCSQYICDITPDLRAQVDYIFALKDNSIANKTKLWKLFFGCFSSFDDFLAVFERCTQNFECLVLDNTVQSTSITDCIFWYKAATDLPAFQVGRPIFFSLEDRMKHPKGHVPSFQADDDAGLRPGKKRLTVIKEEPVEEADER
jgi:energy-coupling factor transporter ATP-binding protein EcfA2